MKYENERSISINEPGYAQRERIHFNRPSFHIGETKSTLRPIQEPKALDTAASVMANVYKKLGLDDETIAKMIPQPGTPEARAFIGAAAEVSGKEIPIFERRYIPKEL